MDICENFSEKLWSKVDPEIQEGFQQFQIARRTAVKSGSFVYFVMDEEGEPHQVTLEGSSSKSDPLHGMANVELKLSEDGSKIVGVKVEEDCMVYVG